MGGWVRRGGQVQTRRGGSGGVSGPGQNHAPPSAGPTGPRGPCRAWAVGLGWVTGRHGAGSSQALKPAHGGSWAPAGRGAGAEADVAFRG